MKQIRFLLILLVGIFFISFISAWSNDTFNNSLTAENLTFTGNENITRWLSVPENTVVTNAFMNLSGYLFINNSFINQENYTTNNNHGLTWISYSGSGRWLEAEYKNWIENNVEDCYDGNYLLGNQNYNVEFTLNVGNNVSKIEFLYNDWYIYNGNTPYSEYWSNLSIYNYSSSSWVIISNYNIPNYYDFCYIRNPSVNIHNDFINTGKIKLRFLEHLNSEVLNPSSWNWEVNSQTCQGEKPTCNNAHAWLQNFEVRYSFYKYPENVSIFIGDNKSWNLTGELNSTNSPQKTLNFAQTINNYISTATAVLGYYLIPFIFHSDTSGILEYSNLIFNDNGFFESSITYDAEINEGEINTISTEIIISANKVVTSAILTYAGINYTTNFIYDGETYTITSSEPAIFVDTDTNNSFKFIITIDGEDFEGTTNNQTVINLDFGICGGVSNDTLLNISLFDEELLTTLIGDIEFNAEIISKSSGETIATVNGTSSSVHSSAICLSQVSSYPLYFLDAEIRYSKDGYAPEFYNIQKADLADYPRNLSLFSLNQNDSTEFSVTYKNNNFIFTDGAIIQLQRKYVGEDVFRTVEAPVTGDGGGTVLHIDLDNVKYKVSVVKDGELLDFFENIVFSCANELAGECKHSLDGTVNPNNDIPIESITDFSYSISVNEDDQTITVLFAVPSGTPSTINVLLEQIDMFGNKTSCNTTVITSSGSIICDYTDTIEKSIIKLSISKNDVQLAIKSFVNDSGLDMDGMNFFIVFLFMISLVGMAISSPEWMIIISIMVLLISGSLLLLTGMNLVMGLGAIAWVLVAAAIIIMKMSKQEDK